MVQLSNLICLIKKMKLLTMASMAAAVVQAVNLATDAEADADAGRYRDQVSAFSRYAYALNLDVTGERGFIKRDGFMDVTDGSNF